jgi:hypothetical protein
MTRFFFDTEFDEDGKTIELISIGITTEKGDEYYAVSRDFDPLHCNGWVRQNVLNKLPPPGDPLWKPRAQIRNEILDFVTRVAETGPKFWAYYADYDWVVLCQLFGKMIDLPPGWPKYCRDLVQVLDGINLRSSDLPVQPEGTEHNALDDARWVRDGLLWIERFYRK